MKQKVIIVLLLILCTFYLPCYAANIIYIDISVPSAIKQQVEFACSFYGLDISYVFVGENEDNLQVLNTLELSCPQAIIIAAPAFEHIDAKLLKYTHHREDGKVALLLIMGLTQETDANLLCSWSNGGIIGCTGSKVVPFEGLYEVSDLKVLGRQLAGQQIPFNAKSVNYLILDERDNAESIIQVANSVGETLFPVFVKTMVDGQEVFFQTHIESSVQSEDSIWQTDSAGFLQIAPLMMFLRYAYGEQCWHSPGYYANLTIDDPWLTEPYGHLSYTGLLKEMEEANFHTTIAFIPWNYDRSEPDVISLFRDHPDRFSICIHGNNHDHYEFYKYVTGLTDPWSPKPLNIQEANIKQALARMEKFKDLTELSCGPVMVFPHGIAPGKTLGLLKKYNFLATSNAGNIPLGSEEPQDPPFYLRAATLKFENFASLTRYSARERSKADIAIDLFLGNPVLFYGHQDLFKDGIDSFNKAAEMVNSIEPTIEWQSLGYITRRLYLERIRDDGNYDVQTFCRIIELENTQKHDLTYFVRKEESFSPPIRQVTVDGQPYPYRMSNIDISLTITIPSGQSRIIDIEYKNDLDLTSVDISKNDPHINKLRRLSDFRDMTLSKNVFGRSVVYLYYETGLYKLGLKRLAIVCLVLATAMGVGGWYLRRYIRNHRIRLGNIKEQTEG